MNQQNRLWTKISVASEKKGSTIEAVFAVKFSSASDVVFWSSLQSDWILNELSIVWFQIHQFFLKIHASRTHQVELYFMVTLPNFRFSIQLDSLFFIQLVKNFRFGPKIRFLGLNPKFFLESSSSVDQADPGLQTEPIDIFDFFFHFSTKKCPYMAQKTVFEVQNNNGGLPNQMKLKSILHPLVTSTWKEI